MWLGFQNAVSGRFIRHNNDKSNWQFDCEGKRHDDWEYFVTRQHQDGGYLLLVKHWGEFLPMKAVGLELAVEKNTDSGTTWEFIKVDYRAVLNYDSWCGAFIAKVATDCQDSS
jgi:hypothetical protein